MKLGGEDQHADAGQHALDDRRRHGPEPLPQAKQAGEELHRPGHHHDQAQCGEAVYRNELADDHCQTGGRAADLQRTAGQQAHHQAADDARNDAHGRGLLRRNARCNGDAHTQGQGHQEHDDRGQEIWLDGTETARRGAGGLGGLHVRPFRSVP